jgi:acetyl-CoA carboxylase biotin carboxyl carrier protein
MSDVEIKSEVTGNVWKIVVHEGDVIAEDDTLMVLESMKMEIPVTSTDEGIVRRIDVIEGQAVSEGDIVCVIGID